MPNYQAVSNAAHATKRWRRYSSYVFAAQDAVAPLGAQELPRALLHLPMAFVRENERFVLVAVLGLQPGQNLFVMPDGRWLGGYVPAVYRGYPFALAGTQDGEHVLVVDADSCFANDVEGEFFFDEVGKPCQAVQDVLNFLTQVKNDRELVQRVCMVLAEHELIQPWTLSVQGGEGECQIEGLYRIDEAALNALPVESFDALRQIGALPVAYCQLLSMQHLQALGKLAEVRQNAMQPLPTTPSGELDLAFLNNNGTISFGAL